MSNQPDFAGEEWVGVGLEGLEVEMQSLTVQKGGVAVRNRFIEAHRKHLRDEVDFWETMAMAAASPETEEWAWWKYKITELALLDTRYPPPTEGGRKECVELDLQDSYWGRKFRHNPNFSMNNPFRPKRTRQPFAGMQRDVSPKGTRKVDTPPPALERAIATARANRVDRVLPNLEVPTPTVEKEKGRGCNPM